MKGKQSRQEMISTCDTLVKSDNFSDIDSKLRELLSQQQYEDAFDMIISLIRKDNYSLTSILYCVITFVAVFDFVVGKILESQNTGESTDIELKMVDILEAMDSKNQRWRQTKPFASTIGQLPTQSKKRIRIKKSKKINPREYLDNLLMQVLICTIDKKKWHDESLQLELEKLNKSPNIDQFSKAVIKYCLGLAYKSQSNLNILYSDEFQYGEEILQAEDTKLEYKNYKFPIVEPQTIAILKKTFCAFLNTQGGVIFFGINQIQKNMTRWVEGRNLSPPARHQFAKFLRNEIIQKINPPVDEKSIKINFLKVHPTETQNQDLCVVRVEIPKGKPDQLYHFYQTTATGREILGVYLRNHSEVIQIREFQDIQREMRRRMIRDEDDSD